MKMILAAMTTAFIGCMGDLTSPGAPDDDILSGIMEEKVASYRAYANVAAPYPSKLGPFMVSLYVSAGQDEYAKIRPDQTGSRVQLPEGALIVREVFDKDGNVAKLTAMAKGPAGYDPTLGDWWFAVTDAAGQPLVENGRVQSGKLTGCHACHNGRGEDDFLFGGPANH